jgi:GrpB-like predicted nucleotidyltransferase (UPF0157 family)
VKQINDLTRKELGQLFPIMLVAPNPEWPGLFKSEKLKIEETLGIQTIVSLEHIGSTAVPNLKAKPSLDILLEIKHNTDKGTIISCLKGIGYEYIPQPDNTPPHMMFVKGYTMQGFQGQAYHIDVRYKGDWDEIYFRDYLIQHPEIAKEYADLKVELAVIHKNDREAYTEAKTKFVTRITDLARNKMDYLTQKK